MKPGDVVSWRAWRGGQRKKGVIRHISIDNIATITALPTEYKGFRLTISLDRLTQETTDDRNDQERER